MNRTVLIIKKIWFGIFNFPYLYSYSEFNVLFWLSQHHRKKSFFWLLISVILNLFPFLLTIVIAYCTGNIELLCFINNGSLPIISFGIVTTNFVYLIENLSTDREIYSNLKTLTTVYAIILIFVLALLFIFQSNFLDSFTHSQLTLSLGLSIVCFVLSVSLGKKMFLLQNKLVSIFEDVFKEQMDKLQIVPNNSDIKF